MAIFTGDRPVVQLGDEFGEFSHHTLAHGINFFQALYAKDHNAKYNHTGIIINANGDTTEALWTIGPDSLWNPNRIGHRIIIVRYTGCSLEVKQKELANLIAYHKGQWYPWWRMFMHIVPPLAKISLFKRPVCSEYTARYEHFIGAGDSHWAGKRPDTLVDSWNQRSGDDYQIIYEGKAI